MSVEVIEQKPTELSPEQAKAFIDARNKGEATPKPTQVDAVVQPEKKAEDHPSRSTSRLQRAIGREQALREAAEARATELEAKLAGTAKAAPDEDAEPKRADFASDAEYLRATQKWDKAQDAKATGKTQQTAAQQEVDKARWQDLDKKANADIETLFPDWDKVMAAAKEDEDSPEFDMTEHPTLFGLFLESDMRAPVGYYFATHPHELQAMLDMSKTPDKQIRAFHRLEGRLEKEYASSKAAQADPEKEKTAPTPQKPQGRADPQQEAQPAKPKPSSEVAARGGSPAPEEPAIGSPAWMLKRNQAQYGH